VEAVVLAGGLGTRLRTAVPSLPKPMAPVAGRPFLEWLLDRWIAQGVQRFVLSIGYRAEAIRGHFGARYKGVEIDYAIEESPLGTGGGLLLGASRIQAEAPFLVLNGDTLLDVELRRLAAFHEERRADVSVALILNTADGRYGGVQKDAQGRIGGFGVRGAAEANGGVYLFERRALARFGARTGSAVGLEQELFPALIADGARLYGQLCEGRFLDIGIPEDYARAAAFLAGSKT
jgi:D-glycero-alpha-D-manno-heptose 1-phosphate guanylyltransferase